MKTAVLLFVLGIFLFWGSFGQSPSDSIFMQKSFGGYTFYQHGQRLTNMAEVAGAMQSNEIAYLAFKRAKANYGIANVFGFAGGFMIGWTLGTAIGGGEPNWTVAGVGGGLLLVSIPLFSNANKRAKLAVNTFNSGLGSSSIFKGMNLELAVKDCGMGFLMEF